jgi:hypothetical protein
MPRVYEVKFAVLVETDNPTQPSEAELRALVLRQEPRVIYSRIDSVNACTPMRATAMELEPGSGKPTE